MNCMIKHTYQVEHHEKSWCSFLCQSEMCRNFCEKNMEVNVERNVEIHHVYSDNFT